MQCLIFRRARIVAALVLLITPSVLLAEVSDKEPTFNLFWTIGLTTALLCLVVARIKPWLGTICLIPAAIWYASLFLEFQSPDVGPHLRSEQGYIYFLQAYMSCTLPLCGLLTGCVLHHRKPQDHTPL